jgi:iron complex transport system ATP-binding protein
MLIDVGGSWAFALRLRSTTVVTMVVVGYAIALSTLLFQTVTTNRILTPSIMGFDSLYAALQTVLIAWLGAAAVVGLGTGGRYALELALMIGFSMLLFGRLFGRGGYSLHLLVLVGIVLGVLFRSVSAFVQRLIDPNEFYVLQERLFASFTQVDGTLLAISIGLVVAVSLVAWRIRHRFDVLLLGRPLAVNVGLDHRRTVLLILCLVAVLVSVSTALVGPVLFFGLLVTNLAYQVVRTNGTPRPCRPRCSSRSSVWSGPGRAATRPRPGHDALRRDRVHRGARLHRAARPERAAMIETAGLRKAYGHTVVVDDVTLEIPSGGVTSIIGPNGAGKSTLLGMIARLLPADAGTVLVDGLDVSTARSDEVARRLSILRQDNHLAVRLTVRDLVGFGRYPWSKGRPTTVDREHVERAIGYVGLDGLADRFLDEMSGGQRQRAFVAMVRCQDTEYVLLDEPLNNLDMKHAVSMMRRLRSAADELGRTVVLVLHDINFASCYSDRMVAMRDGAVVHQGPPDEIMAEPVLKDVYDMDIRVQDVEGRRIGIYFT